MQDRDILWNCQSVGAINYEIKLGGHQCTHFCIYICLADGEQEDDEEPENEMTKTVHIFCEKKKLDEREKTILSPRPNTTHLPQVRLELSVSNELISFQWCLMIYLSIQSLFPW